MMLTVRHRRVRSDFKFNLNHLPLTIHTLALVQATQALAYPHVFRSCAGKVRLRKLSFWRSEACVL